MNQYSIYYICWKQVFTPASFYGKLFRDDVKGGFKW